MYDGSAASIGITVSRAIGLQQSSLGNIGTVGNIIWPQQPSIGSIGIIACCMVLCPWGLSQQSSAHLPAARCHAEGALVKNLRHTCLPQGAMPRGPRPKIFGTLACHKVPCQGGLGQKSSAHLPTARCHTKGALAKNLWHTSLLHAANHIWPSLHRQGCLWQAIALKIFCRGSIAMAF